MKILVIGDLHGRKPRIHFKDFDCIIQVGDVCDDQEIGKIYKHLFKKENTFGYEEYIKKYIGKRNLQQMEKRSLEIGNKILRYLDSFGKPIIFIPGNWDQSYGPSKIKDTEKNNYNYMKSFYDWWLGDKTNSKLIKGIKNLVDSPYQLNEVLGINFIGYGLVSGRESWSMKKKSKFAKNLTKIQFEKLKKAYDKIPKKLNGVFKRRDKKKPLIFISHNIPYNTKLDVGKDKNSYAYKKHLGSYVARKFCEKYQPLLCIGGHVHEGKGKDKIGKTTVINAGFGKDANVLIDLDEKKGKIRKIEFYKGYRKTK